MKLYRSFYVAELIMSDFISYLSQILARFFGAYIRPYSYITQT